MKKIARAIRQQFEQMLAFTTQTDVESGKPYLAERDGILALHFDALSTQSVMNIERPDELVFAYTRTMMSFLLFEPSPRHIAMIGLGGGSLAKYCYRHLPRTKITVVEINPDVISLRNEFAIPADNARFKVLLGCGARWVAASASQTDVLIVDGFDVEGLPEQLSCQQFYDDCYAALADNGIMVVNLWRGYPRYVDFVTRIHKSFAGSMVVVDVEGGFNNIIFAIKSGKFPPPAAILRHHAKQLGLSQPLNFQSKCNKLIQALPTGSI
jgi:spermidine synthase